MAWAEGEFAGADLGDKRLNRRLMQLTECFADKPTASRCLCHRCDWGERTKASLHILSPAV